MKRAPQAMALILSSVILMGCGPVLFKMMGLKKGKELSQDQITTQASKYGINKKDSYEMDTTYMTFVFDIDTIYKTERKNHVQPLQALYYDSAGNLISYHVNCSVGGFPNLKWNKFGAFNQFPAQSQTTLDTLIDLQTHLNFVKNADTVDISKYEYVVLVHWNRFMGRQSKRLIQEVQNNFKLYSSEKVKVIYVNTDNIWANVTME